MRGFILVFVNVPQTQGYEGAPFSVQIIKRISKTIKRFQRSPDFSRSDRREVEKAISNKKNISKTGPKNFRREPPNFCEAPQKVVVPQVKLEQAQRQEFHNYLQL